MKKLTSAFCVLLASHSVAYAATVTTAVVGNAEAGKAKATVCAGCHGADGNSSNPMWPKLAGQHANYLVGQLQKFKAGDRQEPSMSPMAKPLSDQEMADFAAYFSSQPIKPGSANSELVKLGEKIYRGGNPSTGLPACAACHGPQGSGNPAAKYPALNSQHAAYTQKQLENYRAGTRGADSNAVIMHDIAAKITPEEAKAVASYIEGLQ
ncbi:MAG: cytochrome c4 [Beggiatoa sp. IS2]|nr:MAG: cytochrome c4 [Beggiatoa sp. IS2]